MGKKKNNLFVEKNKHSDNQVRIYKKKKSIQSHEKKVTTMHVLKAAHKRRSLEVFY